MRLGLQLFTVRDHVKTGHGLHDSLRRAKDLGYEGVQISAVECMNGDRPEVDARAGRTMLDEFGLECCATHRPIERFESNLESEILFHSVLRCPFPAIAVPPQWARDAGLDGFRRLADTLNQIDEKMRPAGLSMGYHNHAVEFERMGKGGERPFDILVERTEKTVHFILDTYWVWHAGVDLLEQIERLSGRIPVVHLKDKAVFGWEVDYGPVGEGNLNWARILPAFAKAGTMWVVVEQDSSRRDIWDCVASSARFCRAALGALPV